MFDTIQHTLSAAVATSGTFTVSYPANRSAGTYTGAHKHKMLALGAEFTAPDGFTLTFDASNITVTYLGTTTLPAGTTLRLQVDRLGTDNRAPEDVKVNEQIVRAPVHIMSLGSPATADADGVAASQSVAANASFVLNGALVQNGVAVFDTPRNVVAAWTTTAILTITGYDVDDQLVVEKSASGTSHTGEKAFKKVISVTSSASITSATVGTGTVIGLPFFVPDAGYVIAEMKDGALLKRKGQTAILTGRVLCTDGTYGVVHVPYAGTIKSIKTVEIEGGITTNDAVLTFKIGTTAITNGAVTVATSGSAAGVKDSATPTAANALAAGDAINVTVSGTPGGDKSVAVAIEVELSASQMLDGTLTAGVTSAATATTGDVRGTYAPSTAPDGSAYQLLVVGADPGNRGVAQYDG